MQKVGQTLPSLLTVDDIAPSILSFLSVHEILSFATLNHHHDLVSGASWRDLILTYCWQCIVPSTQVDVLETTSLCFSSSLGACTTTTTTDPDTWYKHFVKVAKRDQSYVVIDPGSYQLKAGFGGENAPCCVLDTTIVLGEQGALLGPATEDRDIWIHTVRTLLQILGVQPAAARVCLVLRPYDVTNRSDRSGMRSGTLRQVSPSSLRCMVRACIDGVGVTAVTVRWGPECALFATGNTTGVVVDVGEKMSYCVPVHRRVSVEKNISLRNNLNACYSSSRMSMSTVGSGNSAASHHSNAFGTRLGGSKSGSFFSSSLSSSSSSSSFSSSSSSSNSSPVSTLCGMDLTLHMQSELLMRQGISVTLQEARQLKETECYVRARKSKWMPKGNEEFFLQGVSQIMPSSGQAVMLSVERFQVPEVLLSPERIGKQESMSVVEMVEMVLLRVRAAQRAVHNVGGGKQQQQRGEESMVVYMLGSTLSFRDMSRRLERELKEKDVRKVIHLGVHAAWCGAASVGSGEERDWRWRDGTREEEVDMLKRMKPKICGF